MVSASLGGLRVGATFFRREARCLTVTTISPSLFPVHDRRIALVA